MDIHGWTRELLARDSLNSAKFGHPKNSENGSTAENEAQRESRQVIFSKMVSLSAILLIYAHASLATTLSLVVCWRNRSTECHEVRPRKTASAHVQATPHTIAVSVWATLTFTLLSHINLV